LVDENVVIDIGYESVEKKIILVVDDEVALQSVLFDSLESEFRLISAFNGREGLSKAENVKPDLILMDVMMPDMGGYDAVRLLNTNPLTRHIPVVVMTAQNFDDSTVQLIKQESNVVQFLTKPFRPKALRELVRKVLEKKA
jgi:CheY-like chemotaxis protein